MLYSAVAVAAIAGSTLVGAAPVLNARKAAPTGWAHKILEDYNTYHVRYLALSCYTQHNTTFFDDCCHPLRVNETVIDDRLAYCAPNATALAAASSRVAAAASAASASAIPSAVPSDDASAQWVSIVVDNVSALPTGDLAAVATSIEQSWSAADATSTSTEQPQVTAEVTADAAELLAPTTTTEEPKPTTTTTEKPQTTETTTTTEATKTTTTTEEPAATETQASGGGSGTTYSGKGTFYDQSEGADPSGLGSCGWKNNNNEPIAAISSQGRWANNVACGKQVVITNKANGKSVTVQIVDACPTCPGGEDSIDLSPSAFKQIAEESTGVIDIAWQFV